MIIDSQKIEQVLKRGVEKIYPTKEALEEVLKSGKKIRLYNGIDPTGKLHLGHLAVLKKLRQFQDLGHEVIVLIGDFTATIGDPTDKSAVRKPLTRSEVLANARSYKKQIAKILDIEKANVKANVRFLHNERWTNKLKPIDLLEIFSNFTVARLLERDMFQKRIKEGKDILLHEFVYPVFQAYDSVTMDVDLEVGGNDQTFNMMRGRDLMKKMKNKEKFVMALKLLTDPTGKKMGKTEGNLVALDDNPNEIFGKIMSWPDELIETGFELLTDVSEKEIQELLSAGQPKLAKMRLAKELVKICHDEKKAILAQEEFESIHKEKGLPSDVPVFQIKPDKMPILDLLVQTKLAVSKSEAKRLILQGGVKIDGVTENDWQKIVAMEPPAGRVLSADKPPKRKNGLVLQVGRRKFAKILR